MRTRIALWTLSALTALALVSTAIAADKAAPKKNAATAPTSSAFGQSFSDWLRDFWAWSFGGVGDQLQPNNVMFMPIPTPGEDDWQVVDGKTIGTASVDLKVKPGTKLVLGVLSWIGETYDPTLDPPVADDQPWGIEEFLPPNGEAVITLDGIELINSGNLAQFYYGPTWFKEPLMYPEPSSYGSIGAIWVQGIGIILNPLTPGKHTLTLYSWDHWKGYYGEEGVGWFNTWHITVESPGKARR